jgi:murein peptide amidase A
MDRTSKSKTGIVKGALALGLLVSLFSCSSREKQEADVKAAAEDKQLQVDVGKWCEEVQSSARGLKWTVDACRVRDWKIGGRSVEGRPLVYAEFGDPSLKNTTLIFSTVHGDEVTPLYVGLQVANWMADHQSSLAGAHVIVAPLVNPDGFFRKPRTRMNARGVDVNRNFATRDWDERAHKAWKLRHRKDPRRFPGPTSRSEPETIFQEELIKKYRPQKIMAIHAPLNVMDYDGPGLEALKLDRFPKEYVQRCLKLRGELKAVSTGFFPGSLGNYAGQELGIPTLTLELPSADARKAEGYWRTFQQGIREMIEFTVPAYAMAPS